MKRPWIRLSAALIIFQILILPFAVFGQVEKRVVFTKAKPAVSLKGKLPRNYADYDAYVFKAKKGQTLTIKLTTTSPDASFAVYELNIYGPDEDQIVSQNELNRTYTGKIPITSEFAVQVYGVTSSKKSPGSGAAYTIEISVK